jgi:predicted regulator of Ras-like GTPase activity (Roadblock/LC7/MglB family)
MSMLLDLLNALTSLEGINAAVVVNRDGFMIDGVMHGDMLDMEHMAAIISAGIGSSEQIARQLALGELSLTIVECENGVVMVVPITEAAIMAVLADPDAKLGSVRYKLKKYLVDIKKAL